MTGKICRLTLLVAVFTAISIAPRGVATADADPVVQAATNPSVLPGVSRFTAGKNGKYTFTIDTSDTPDLTEWANTELAPVMIEWYPKIVDMLPSDGFEAPHGFTITFHDKMDGVANTAGTRINCAAAWYRNNLKGEAKGSLVHELVHVAQQYWTRPHARRVPSWLTEGIADYIRWYKYEPQSHGTRISKARAARVKYTDSYRTTANFLDYVSGKYDKDLVLHLNAAVRDGKYSNDTWRQLTGKPVADLAMEWKTSLGAPPATLP